MKHTKYQLEAVVTKIKRPFSLDEAAYLCSEILRHIITVFNIIVICHASCTVVQRRLSIMNLIMNDL